MGASAPPPLYQRYSSGRAKAYDICGVWIGEEGKGVGGA